MSFTLVGSSVYTQKIKWWVNIGIIVVGIFWIYMSYLEHIDPIGNASVRDTREWWILGVIAILAGVYWIIQRVVAKTVNEH